MSAVADQDAPQWRRLLEEAPARLELPTPPEVPPVGDPSEPATALTPDPDHGLWACLLAGLATRYTQSAGPVVVTVAEAGRLVPVVVDLTDDPGLDAALARWSAAAAEHSHHGLDPGDLLVLARIQPAVAQVVLRLDETAWPGPTPPTLCLALPATTPTLLAGGASRPDIAAHLAALRAGWHGSARLSAVPLLDEPERARVLAEGRGRDLDIGDRTVGSLVAHAAAARPDAEAVKDAHRSLTYAGLLTEVDTLAAALVAAHVGRGSLVGLCVDRGVGMVVAMLAVHRCGAAYVPIDPDYPPDRIAMMVEDAELAVLLSERGLADRVAAPGLPRVLLDADLPTAGGTLDGVLPAGPDDLAYVIFTSGSTGRPKGVAIGQRALASFVLSMARTPGLHPEDRLLAVTTLSFDIAELELLVPLTVGACVVVADRPTTLDPRALAARLESDAVTVMQATPATWRMLVDDGWPGRPGLRVFCGGEALPRSLADALVTRCAELWNMYGPTETTIWSMVGRVQVAAGRQTVLELTIGEPIHNTSVVVADPGGHPVPDGVAGELWIGGTGVAQGYLGRPDLTAERFVPDVLTGAGERIYRTGDLVRRVPGRGIEFIGRIDGQVKVRGFRVELAEVEAALESHPGVAHAVAVTRPDPASGGNRLLAYVVAGADLDDDLDPLQLRQHAGATVPDYMVPSIVTLLAAFPLTLNGKVDRKGLPDPQPLPRGGDQVAPRSALEARITAIWESVLGVDGLGVTDDVFDLGSSSLTTARLYATVSRDLGIELPIGGAFRCRTVAALAELVERSGPAGSDDAPASLVPIRTTGGRPPLFLVHGGAGTILLYEPLARRLPADVPVYALQAAGLYGRRAPQTSVPDMAALYLTEIRSVQPHGPYRIGGYCFGALVAFEMAAQLQRHGERAELLVSFNGPAPSYLRRYRPLFDAHGALTDEAGQLLRPRGIAPVAARSETDVHDRVPTTRRVVRAGRATARRVRSRAGGLRRRLRVEAAIRLGRPLPDDLRENGVFQHLAAQAQQRYRPGRVRTDMQVVTGAGLYHRPDIGWSDHADGEVEVVEIQGAHRTPRSSMRAEAVGPIVARIAARLDELDAARID